MENKTIQNQNNKLYWVYLVGFFLILLLPLLNLPPWFSPPDWGKTVVFRIILTILIFLFLLQILLFPSSIAPNNAEHYAEKRRRFSVVQRIIPRGSAALPFWLLVALLGIYLLATIFSRDILFSLWGNPYRSGGFVNFAFYIIFAILAFLILKQKDWQKIWDFALIGGILVSVVAIFQQFGYFSKILVSVSQRPPSTIGGPIFLAIYLLLLSFIGFSFGIKSKDIIKKIFYFFSFLLFIFVIIFIAQTRAAIVGITIAFLWFLFSYPVRKSPISDGFSSKKLILLKIIAGIILISGISGVYFLKTHPEVYSNQPIFVVKTINRISELSEGLTIAKNRISAWKVSLKALKERPIFGYGLENFSIAFDKYYDPSLPQIAMVPELEHRSWYMHITWWDRAHNFVFDNAVTAGVPALMVYLALFGTLFWQLQRLKSAERNADNNADKTLIVAHGIQATFIGYFIANISSFDTFSSYLISFLLISYALHLISEGAPNNAELSAEQRRKFSVVQRIVQRSSAMKIFLILFLSVILVWFIYAFNIKPFKINTQINIAKYLVGDKKCEAAFSRMDKILEKKSFLDSYLRLKYIDYLRACEAQHPEKTYDYAQKGAKLLKENTEIQPYNVRDWLLLAGFMNVLIDKEQNQQNWEKLVSDTKSYLEKAEELSPKRQEVLLEWAKFSLVANNYQLMKEKSQKCIDVNPDLADCYWFNGLAEIFLGNLEKGEKNLAMAQEKGYNRDSLISLIQLAKAQTIAQNYQELAEVYQKLISLKPEEPQYHATLAFVYKELKDYKKAREEAIKVLELQPEAREMVEEFLKSLKAR